MEALIARLQSIHDSDRGVMELIAQGEAAVPALREFLLNGRPATVFQPRMNAVKALAEIGAKSVLIEYLRHPIGSNDPVVRLGEEAVRNTALRELVRWPDEDVATTVMDILRERPLPGACEAAGRLRLLHAAPYLVDALADDVSRPPAMDALRSMLPEVTPLLIETSLRWRRDGSEDDEPPLHRRAQAAMRVLSESALTPEEGVRLDPLLICDDPEIVACASRILLKARNTDRGRIASAMIDALVCAPLFHGYWFIRNEIRELLESCGPDALSPLDAEIRRRKAVPPEQASHDMLLPMLVNVQRRINEKSP